MIVDFFLDVGMNIADWVLGLFGDGDSLDFLSGFAAMLATVFGNIAGLGAWVPWPIVVGVVGTIFTLWGVFVLVKFVTWIKGLFWASS